MSYWNYVRKGWWVYLKFIKEKINDIVSAIAEVVLILSGQREPVPVPVEVTKNK